MNQFIIIITIIIIKFRLNDVSDDEDYGQSIGMEHRVTASFQNPRKLSSHSSTSDDHRKNSLIATNHFAPKINLQEDAIDPTRVKCSSEDIDSPKAKIQCKRSH